MQTENKVNEIIGTVRKSNKSEIIVSRSTYKGREVIDIRLWFLPKNGIDLIPSRKGLTIEDSKAHNLIEILKRA